MSEQYSPDVTRLAEQYTDHLIDCGFDALEINPVVDMRGVASGRVWWPESAYSLAGLEVRKMASAGHFPEDAERYEELGLSRQAQAEGYWVVRGYSLALDEAGEHWNPVPNSETSFAWAHFDPVDDRWTIIYRKDDPAYPWGDVRNYHEPTDTFRHNEDRAIKRIGDETTMLLDTAVTLGDKPANYFALRHALTDGEYNDGYERDAMLAAIVPTSSSIHPALQWFATTVYAQIDNFAPPLYRALAGKEIGSSHEIEAVQTMLASAGHVALHGSIEIGEAMVCPAYRDPGDGLKRRDLPTLERR